jgi:hypothetical protein
MFVVLTGCSSNYDFAESILLAGFARQGILIKDPTVWLDGDRPHQIEQPSLKNLNNDLNTNIYSYL